MFEHAVECPHCGRSIMYDWSDFVIDSEVIDEDRGMGEETEHIIECEDFECPHCHRKLNVNGSVWEYPEGVYNDHTLDTSKN